MTAHLYRLFDEGGDLLYVGVTERWPTRLEEHQRQQAWAGDIARATTEPHPTMTAALTAERRAIAVEDPAHNVEHSPQVSSRRNWTRPAYRNLGIRIRRRRVMCFLTQDELGRRHRGCVRRKQHRPDGSLRSHYKFEAGLTVRDWKYVVRIANIDRSALTADASAGADLPDLMFQAQELVPNIT